MQYSVAEVEEASIQVLYMLIIATTKGEAGNGIEMKPIKMEILIWKKWETSNEIKKENKYSKNDNHWQWAVFTDTKGNATSSEGTPKTNSNQCEPTEIMFLLWVYSK